MRCLVALCVRTLWSSLRECIVNVKEMRWLVDQFLCVIIAVEVYSRCLWQDWYFEDYGFL
jgi:hypothetical protein